jgi:16S rRNA (cytidine1402-2'-O)-methyltransferase
MSGTLYVVATPIGNLEDISPRALRILQEVSLIACEDTRHTSKLLRHYGISTRLVSLHEHNERERAVELVKKLELGDNVALVSDSGTPLISDPGFRLVRQAAASGIPVSPVPGPSALIAALAAAGLPTGEFHFCGFLPPKAPQRRKKLEALRGLRCTLVFYEAPHRVVECLADIAAILDDPPLVAARELTKMHEELLRGHASAVRDVLARREAVKGEFTIVVGPPEAPTASPDDSALRAEVEQLLAAGSPRMDAIKTVAHRYGLSKRRVYGAVFRDCGNAPS